MSVGGNNWQELSLDNEKIEVEDAIENDDIDISLDEVETPQKETKTPVVENDSDEEVRKKRALQRKERLAKQQLEEVASVAQELAAQNKQLAEELANTRKKTFATERNMYKNVATQLEGTVSALQDQIEQAFSTSDFKKAAELTVKLQKAVVQQQAYAAVSEEEAEAEESEAAEEKPIASQRHQNRQEKQRLPPALEEWLEDNPWFYRKGVNEDEADKRRTRLAVQISDTLLKEGFSASDDDFYEELNARLRKTPDTKKKFAVDTQPQKGTQGGIIRRDGKLYVKPTQDDINMAKRMGLYDPTKPDLFKKYLKEKAKGEASQGQYVDIDV